MYKNIDFFSLCAVLLVNSKTIGYDKGVEYYNVYDYF